MDSSQDFATGPHVAHELSEATATVRIGGDLEAAGMEVRVVAADPRIRHRLPYTLRLRKSSQRSTPR